MGGLRLIIEAMVYFLSEEKSFIFFTCVFYKNHRKPNRSNNYACQRKGKVTDTAQKSAVYFRAACAEKDSKQ